jgi:uncharacterized protein YbbC (DUF1343 family)
LNAARVAELLNARRLGGLRFDTDSFTPQNPGDAKFAGIKIPGVHLVVTDRNAVQPGRVSAAILWAVTQANRDSLRIAQGTFDERFGSAAMRQAIVAGTDPDVALASDKQAVDDFLRGAQRYRLYP